MSVFNTHEARTYLSRSRIDRRQLLGKKQRDCFSRTDGRGLLVAPYFMPQVPSVTSSYVVSSQKSLDLELLVRVKVLGRYISRSKYFATKFLFSCVILSTAFDPLL